MSPPDDGTAGFDGPMDPTDDPSSTDAESGKRSDRESSSEFLPERLIADLRLEPSNRHGALGRLGHYDILSIVGAGAMGVVLKAFDNQLHRTVAIKVLSSHLMASDQARARFEREARAAAPLNHPNVVTIHAVEKYNGIPYLVMEFVDGISLQQRIVRSAPMLAIDILRLSQQIAVGLAAAHRNGVIHRDIKPANIMLEDGIERVKITDFGLAKAAMGDIDLTSFGKMIGTPSYMSPEQVSGDPLDGRSDLYSLGCVMYAMVAGTPPFRGDNCLAVAHRIRTEAPHPLRERHPEVPRFLEAIILRLLEKSPEKRFQSADELAAVLTQRLAKVNLAGSSYVFSDGVTTKVLKTSETATSRRSRFQGAIVLTAMVLILGTAISAFFGGKEEVPEVAASKDVPPPIEQRPVLTVNRDPDAAPDAATIKLALSKVEKPWTRIVVGDDAIYREVIYLDDDERFYGLSLEAPHGATIEYTEDGAQNSILARTTALIDIEGVSNVRVRGFRLRPGKSQWGIRIRGRCPGLDISEIRSEHEEPSERVFLYAHEGASGTAERPIRLHHLVAKCGAGGLYITADNHSPVENIDVEDNVIIGTSTPKFICPLIGFTEDPGRNIHSHANINIQRNVFMNGTAGVHLLPEHRDSYQSVRFLHNTFCNLHCLVLATGKRIFGTGLSFDSNLVLDTKQVIDTKFPQERTETWFRNMHWEFSEGCNQTAIDAVAKLHPQIPMQSRTFGEAGFMQPQPGVLPEVADPFPGAYSRTTVETSKNSEAPNDDSPR